MLSFMTKNITAIDGNRSWLQKTAFIFSFWTGLAAVTAAQVYFGVSQEIRGDTSYGSLFLWHATSWYSWALLTPVIFWLGRRFSFERPHRFLAIVFHFIASIVIALVVVLLENVVAFWHEGVPLFQQKFVENYVYILTRTLHQGIILYWLILVSAFAFRYFQQLRHQTSVSSAAPHEKDRGNSISSEIRIGKASVYSERIAVKSKGSVILIKVTDIDWIEAADYYAQIHTGGKNYLLRESLNALEKKLNQQKFIRIHRSSIVNIDRVKEMQPYHRGDYIVILQDGTKLKLSRHRREQFRTILGQSL